MIKKLFSFLALLIALWSCKAEKVTIPAYVQIDDYTVKINDSTGYGTSSTARGTTNQKFTDIYELHLLYQASFIYRLEAR